MEQPNIWTTTYLNLLKNNTNPTDIKFWLDQLRWGSIERDGSTVKVELNAPSTFYAKYIDSIYREEIERAIGLVLGESCSVKIGTSPVDEEQNTSLDLSMGQSLDLGLDQNNIFAGATLSSGFTEDPLAPAPYLAPTSPVLKTGSITGGNSPAFNGQFLDTIDSALTFDKYIVGPSNQFAYASALSTAEKPATQYNPLFIYGPPAVGKTHLLHAIGNQIKSRNPNIRAYFVSAEKFVNEFIESIQHKNPGSFRSKYRDNVDLLLIDDVQFIVGKERSQEEFIHTFNTLHSLKKMIVLTSDKAPKDIDGLEERIRTRFEMGLVADIRPPEIETRIAILKARAEADDVYLPDDVATFLGTYIKDTVRNLHGSLVKIKQFADLTGAEITLDLAKQVLHQSIPEDGQEYTVEMILTAICKHFNIKLKELKGVSRASSSSLPRQIAMYLIRCYTQLNHREVGAIFGKDHSTVVHAIKKIEIKIESDLDLKRHIEAIRGQL